MDHNYRFEESFPAAILVLFGFENFLKTKEMVNFDVNPEIFGRILSLLESTRFHKEPSVAPRLLDGIERLHTSFGISPSSESVNFSLNTVSRFLAEFSPQVLAQLVQLFNRIGYKVSLQSSQFESFFHAGFVPARDEPILETLLQLDLISEDAVFLSMKESLYPDRWSSRSSPEFFRFLRRRVNPALLAQGNLSLFTSFNPKLC